MNHVFGLTSVRQRLRTTSAGVSLRDRGLFSSILTLVVIVIIPSKKQ